MVQLIDKTTELVDMRDPSVSSLKRPMLEQESTDFGDIVFEDFRFNLGVYFEGKNGKPLDIPVNIGRILFKEDLDGNYGNNKSYKTKKCTKEMFSHVNLNLTSEVETAFESSYCPDLDNARINGVENFGPALKTTIFFESCWDDDEITDKESTCLSRKDTCDWVDANKDKNSIKLHMLHSFSFLDFDS